MDARSVSLDQVLGWSWINAQLDHLAIDVAAGHPAVLQPPPPTGLSFSRVSLTFESPEVRSILDLRFPGTESHLCRLLAAGPTNEKAQRTRTGFERLYLAPRRCLKVNRACAHYGSKKGVD